YAQSNEITATQLAVEVEVEEGKLAHQPCICRRTGSAPNGAFWPTILPLFHGSRLTRLATDSMMDSRLLRAVKDAPTLDNVRAVGRPAADIAGRLRARSPKEQS